MIRPRADWQSADEPVTGPAATPNTINSVVAHYTGAATVGADTAAVLRAIQHDYLTHRPTYDAAGNLLSTGYSVGYGFAVDKAGQAWELRGLDIKCAANKGVNESTYAILCLVDGADPANTPMVNGIREVVATIRRHLGRPVPIQGHQDVGQTACPGVGVYGQIKAGLFEPVDLIAPQPLEPNPLEDNTVTYLHLLAPGRPDLLVALDGAGVTVVPLTGDDVGKVVAAYNAVRVDCASVGQYDQFLSKSH